MQKPLLPKGCYDLLPPFARRESELSHALLSVFESYGYEQVTPPLLEYSDSFLAGRGAALSSQIFRVMDPTANKVMGLRPDITLQIARIASSRMADSPRPLRLCYNGLILRVQGSQLHGDRQLRQAGIELIGASCAEADAEVILVAARALAKAGVKKLSIDLNLPGIVGSLLASEKLDNQQLERLLAAVAHKDVSALRHIPFSYRDTLIALLQSAGPAARALETIDRLDLPESARSQLQDLKDVVSILVANGSADWSLTVDATENRGLTYYAGISFSIFVPGVSCEVGRGGRYVVEGSTPTHDTQATGFTLYVDTLRELLPAVAEPKRIFVRSGTSTATVDELHAQGYVTIFALGEYGTDEDEARRLGCQFIWNNNSVKAL